MKNSDFAKKAYRWGQWGYQKLNPLHNIISGIEYTLTAEGRRLRHFKDIHKGERCFIIGNGPSLKMHDLTKLSSEIKFATNMFLLHKDLEKIHLDYFCVSDPLHWQDGVFPKNWEQAFKMLPYCTFFFEKGCIPVYKRTPELQDSQVYFLNLDSSRRVFEGDFSIDVSSHTCWGRTVIIDFCLPLAFYFGFKEIFLLGCDSDYGHKEDVNHFKDHYFYESSVDGRKLSVFNTDKWFNDATSSYEVVKKLFEAHGRRIYNAGFGGKLEVFERVDYDDLF